MEKIPNGFTLLELIITISILMILTIAAVPSFTEIMTTISLKNAAHKIYSDLRYAQSESLKSNNTIFVSFSNSKDHWCYGFSENKHCDCNEKKSCKFNGSRKVIKDSSFNKVELQQARFAGKKNYTAFSKRNGFAVADGVKNGTIWIKKNDVQIAIIVNRLGRIRFCSPTIAEYSKRCPKAP